MKTSKVRERVRDAWNPSEGSDMTGAGVVSIERYESEMLRWQSRSV
jgi:hypothetical protein